MGTILTRLLCCLLLIGFALGATSPSSGLKWVRVNVPQYRVPGETAMLQCDFDLGNDTLYAVKWYKEHEEFYRFVPKARPQAQAYEVEGVHVDKSKSDSRKVVLHPVSWKTSGLYRCEVSAEAPSFASAQSEARMEVVSAARKPSDNGGGAAVSNRRRDQPELHVGKEPSCLDSTLVHKRATDPEIGGADPLPAAPPPQGAGVLDAGAALPAEHAPLPGWFDEGEVRGFHSAHPPPQRQGECRADAKPADKRPAGGSPTCEKFDE